MTNEPTAAGVDRRGFLKLTGLGALTLTAGGGLAAALAKGGRPAQAGVVPSVAPLEKRLVATDGFIHLPGRPDPRDLYTFGFRDADLAASIADLEGTLKGMVTVTAPHIAVDEGQELLLTLTNIGFQERPDLDDSHTIHWHGFRNPITLFDGVPEVSIAVPPRREFTYYYRAENPGTYIYHCHFEDSEHVQLQMTGVVWIRPAGFPKRAYFHELTAFDREFALLFNEIDERPHDNLVRIQEFVWSDYEPQYWIINGRAYPDTIEPNEGETGWSSPGAQDNLAFQPNSSLVQCNPGEKVLLRMANLGYDQHAIQVPGIPLTVVGEDATFLQGPGSPGADLSYGATSVYIGPGETRDVIFTAPGYVDSEGKEDPARPGKLFNRYFLRNRNLHTLVNGDAGGPGGMQTEVRVYGPATPVLGQDYPNQTYA